MILNICICNLGVKNNITASSRLETITREFVLAFVLAKAITLDTDCKTDIKDLLVTSWALHFTNVDHIHAISPVALLILKLDSVFRQDATVQTEMVVVSGLRDKLHSVSPQGIFIPVVCPLESEFAIRTLVNWNNSYY